MAEQELTFVLRLKQEFSRAAQEVGKSLATLENAGKKTADSLAALQDKGNRLGATLSNVVNVVKGLAAAYVSLAAANKSIELAERQTQAEQKLAVALRGNTQLLLERQRAAKQISEGTTFGDQDVLEADALLRIYGVSEDQIDAALKAVVNRASALNTDLLEQARQIGATFASGLSGELGEKEAEIKRLGSVALRTGEQFQILADKYAGFPEALASTPFGRSQQLINAFGDQAERIGDVLIRLKVVLLESLLPVFTNITVLWNVEGRGGAEGIGTTEDHWALSQGLPF